MGIHLYVVLSLIFHNLSQRSLGEGCLEWDKEGERGGGVGVFASLGPLMIRRWIRWRAFRFACVVRI